MSDKSIRIALAGNPNSGKTSLFNALTGARRNVGNYPGVTVEKKDGNFTYDDLRVEISDLPGAYSLTSFSPEERIAREEILSGRFDIIIIVVDSTNLRRNLYLMTQVMLAGANPILCLNMSDESKAAGQELDLAQMEKLLGFPVLETVGNRGIGTDKLKKLIAEVAGRAKMEEKLVLGEQLDAAIGKLAALLEDSAPQSRPPRWLAVKLLEGDELARAWVAKRMPDRLEGILRQSRVLTEDIEDFTKQDIATFIADCHYGFVAGLLAEVVLEQPREDARRHSDQIDAIVCHRLFGPFFFLGVMYSLFYFTFTIGDYPMGWIEALFSWMGETLSGFWPEGSDSPIRSLLVDGIIGGVGGVIVFLPNIVLLFMGLAFLEDSGYMARAAFLMDRIMHRFGLHGKSFIPMMTGFGCSIPGIMATRTLENEVDRLTTMMVLPLMSCGARLPIWMLLIPAFFPDHLRASVLFGIYLFGILLAVFLARLLRSTLLRGQAAPFVMELPPYRMPTARALLSKMGERSWLYLRKAGTIILGISIVLWALSSYPKQEDAPIDRAIKQQSVQIFEFTPEEGLNEEEAEEARTAAFEKAMAARKPGILLLSPEEVERRRASDALKHSAAGRIGGLIEPLLRPLGFDVAICTALIGTFAAKEVFVAQMGIVFSLGDDESSMDSLRKKLAASYSPLIALSLMIFLLIATPCMATVAITRRESGSWKWAFLQLGGLTLIAWVISALVYQVGLLIV